MFDIVLSFHSKKDFKRLPKRTASGPTHKKGSDLVEKLMVDLCPHQTPATCEMLRLVNGAASFRFLFTFDFVWLLGEEGGDLLTSLQLALKSSLNLWSMGLIIEFRSSSTEFFLLFALLTSWVWMAHRYFNHSKLLLWSKEHLKARRNIASTNVGFLARKEEQKLSENLFDGLVLLHGPQVSKPQLSQLTGQYISTSSISSTLKNKRIQVAGSVGITWITKQNNLRGEHEQTNPQPLQQGTRGFLWSKGV